ncbi:hypothetical protein CDAR_296781 [Caerostris darwini]|uniref:Ycf15 n=1 Tax=Caerostris darwini TaxID=1538125 RepID=A0AAV4N6R9_9ARAC|nr:hypothetical protein CDAR_296781 [Caerostris darwini]
MARFVKNVREWFDQDKSRIQLPFIIKENRCLLFSKIKEKYKGVRPEEIPLRLWFHLQWDYLDNPHKPKTWKVFREKLSIELLCQPS